MKRFILKYVLPDNTVVGYHLDSSCHMGSREGAKVYEHGDPQSQIEIVRKNFKWVWDNSEPQYRSQSVWKGASFEQIQIIAEETSSVSAEVSSREVYRRTVR